MAFTKRRKRKRTIRGGWGLPWTPLSWPYQTNGTYYPVNSYMAQADRILSAGSRRRR